MASSSFLRGNGNSVAEMLFLMTFCLCCTADLLDPSLFSQTLTKLATDGLGVSNLQEHFDRLKFTETVVDGSQLIPNLAASVSNKFRDRFHVVQRLKTAVESSWPTPPSSIPTECCRVSSSSKNAEYDSRFRKRLDISSACVKVSQNAPPSPKHVANSVVEEMKNILQDNPFIKWQYFASEEGTLANYPAFEDTEDCRSYDPRFRPFYVETATPKPKDVVLVLDTSGSMKGSRLRTAKEAAKTFLSTTNPRDRIGIVSFSDKAATPIGYRGDGRDCHSERLADATPINIKYMDSYVDSLSAGGDTQYSKAFRSAFNLLKGSSSGGETSRTKVIIFLTDGKPTDEPTEIMQTIQTENAELDNKVVIMTYGMEQDLQILRDIANQDGGRYGVSQTSDVTAGKFTYVGNTENLRRDLATYYDFFSENLVRDAPIISIPYIDAFGTGLLTSITLPCYYQGKFIGVVGTDISMEDLLSEITYFQRGQSSYAFMVDSSGRTMMHPLLPALSDAFGDPIFMDITALEAEPEFTSVFLSIKSGKSGQRTFPSKRFLARGGQVEEGVTVATYRSTYFWEPVQHTNFTVTIVVKDSDKDETLDTQTIPSDFEFLYHRLDLVKPDSPCVHFSRYAAKDSTVVKFSAEAFTDPYKYLGLDESVSKVNAYERFMKSARAINPGFKTGIRNTVIATKKVEDIWFREKSEYTKYLVWRYVGTANGVFRMTPGTLLAKSYDPRKRPWYHTALSNTGSVALSTPYIDAFGAGVVITAAHTLYRGETNSQHSTSDQVIGVMGADFPLSYFQKLLTDTYPKCEESSYDCFVLDTAGFLIMHNDFLQPDITAKTLEYVHITEKEKDISEDLIQKGYLVKKECRNLEKIGLQSFYELKLPFQGVSTLENGQRCKKYQLLKVGGSNAFLGIISREGSCSSKACSCSTNKECSNVKGLSCECPCSSRLEFHYCRSEFPASNISICPVPATVVLSERINDPSVNGLGKCFDPQCDKKPDSESCDGVVGCYWCVRDKFNTPLSKKYCADINTCYGGTQGTRAPGSGNIPTNPTNPEDDDDKGGLSAGAIVGIVLGLITVIIVIIITTFIFVKDRERFSRPITFLAPAPAVERNALPCITRPPGYPYRPKFGFPENSASVNIPPPLSYDQITPSFPNASAPPYAHYHKGLH